jgi:hypothetical protein
MRVCAWGCSSASTKTGQRLPQLYSNIETVLKYANNIALIRIERSVQLINRDRAFLLTLADTGLTC